MMEFTAAIMGVPWTPENFWVRTALEAWAGNTPDEDSVLFALPRKFGFFKKSEKTNHRGIWHDIMITIVNGLRVGFLGFLLGVWTLRVGMIVGVVGALSHLLADSVDDESEGFMLLALLTTRRFRFPVVLATNAVVPASIRGAVVDGEERWKILSAYFIALKSELRWAWSIPGVLLLCGISVRIHSMIAAESTASIIASAIAFLLFMLTIFMSVTAWREGRNVWAERYGKPECKTEVRAKVQGLATV